MSGLFAVLMAGGSGTRFWPASRHAHPKQLLPIGGEEALLVATSRRLRGAIPAERQLIITAAHTVNAVRSLLPELPAENVVGEPEGRDTAACVGLASHLVARIDPDATVVAMPADQLMQPEQIFTEHLSVAEQALDAHPEAVLVFGVQPDRPATSYGWLRQGAPVGEFGGRTVYALDAFIEKPGQAMAQQLLDAGGHSWNAGLFAFRPAALQAAYAQHLPELGPGLARIAATWGTPAFDSELTTHFPSLRQVSIDKGVMEKLSGCLMLPLPLTWDDVGSWSALERLKPADEHGNHVDGQALLLAAKRNLVATTDGGLVAIKGVDDLIVVHTPDATLVCRRDDDQGVKEIVEALSKLGWTQFI